MVLKENVIVGHLIPAGTGAREYKNLIVANKEEYESLQMSREEFERSAKESRSQEDIVAQ